MEISRSVRKRIKKSLLGQIALFSRSIIKGKTPITSLGGKIIQYKRVLDHCVPKEIDSDEMFFYYINEKIDVIHKGSLLSNMPVDYSLVLKSGLRDLISTDTNNPIVLQNNELVQNMINYVERIVKKLNDSGATHTLIFSNLKSMLSSEPLCLSDACQRILIWNQLIWQTGHNLMGLGRLDKILEIAYKRGQLKHENTEEVIGAFLKALHKHYKYKSAALVGDTGQVIELGGDEIDGSYFYNDLTIIFLKKIRELHIPDPKFILRVSRGTPQMVWEEAVQTIYSGIGNPLLSNDNIIVPTMCEYYKSKEVGYGYATTACWSPVALGNSIGQCNPIMIQMVEPFMRIFQNDTRSISTFEEFLEKYYITFEEYIDDYIADVDEIVWEKDPILTLFTDGCIDNEKDISDGGAIYNNYGMQSIGFPNLINSLLNIRKYVFKEERISLTEVGNVLCNNYVGFDDYAVLLRDEEERFGNDEAGIIAFTNDVLYRISDIIGKKQNRFGQSFKFGISSATFIIDGNKTKATFDGRKAGRPLGVQISSDHATAYSEIANFASKLCYSAVFSNGNVMDLMVDRFIFEKNADKMTSFLKTCIEIGVFQIQINILSIEELLDAKAHPEKHTNLIVRVWGFNSYFNDLPEDYKDLIIERAMNAKQGF